jgi:hypothetical protein
MIELTTVGEMPVRGLVIQDTRIVVLSVFLLSAAAAACLLSL